MIKFFCDIEGLQENWIGMSESWTGKEAKAAEESMNGGWNEYLSFLSTKVDDCNIVAGDVIITDFKDINDITMDLLDVRLSGFIGGILQQTILRLRALGNAAARVSSSGNVGSK